MPRFKLTLIAACVAALALPGSSPALDYVALGDSVASGYGLRPAAPPCFRTARAYPRLVLEHVRERATVGRFTFLACSGAAATGEVGPRSLTWQVSGALERIRRKPTLVSITIGMNDLEWWNVSRVSELLDGDRGEFEEWLSATVGDIRAAVRRELDRLLALKRVSVVLSEYYDPFNRGSPIFLLCSDPSQCRARTEEVVTRLNQGLRDLAGSRVRVASVQRRFEAHEAARPRCGVSPPEASATWIQPDCLHPNGRGAAAIAAAVDREARVLGR